MTVIGQGLRSQHSRRLAMMAECDFCPNKEEKPEVGMPEGWARWQVSPNVYLAFCRACVPRVAQFLTQKLKDTVDKVDHESYHIDVDYSERGDRVAVLVPNRDCPHCLAQTEREMQKAEQEREAQPRPRVTRDMALDAEDPSLEGQVY